MGQEEKISLFGKFQWLDNWDIDSEDLTKLLSSLFGKFHWLGHCLEETSNFTKTDKL